MTRDTQDLRACQSAMESERAPEERAWRDIAAMIRPDDQDFTVAGQKQPDGTECFDSAPLHYLDEFSAGMFTENVNPAERWMELTVATADGDTDLANFKPVKDWCWGETGLLFRSLSPAVSPFYTEAPAYFSDLGAFGFGSLYQDEVPGEQRICDRAIPLGESYIKLDLSGQLTDYHRKFMATGAQIKGWWRNSVPANCRDDAKYELIHAVHKNDGYRRGMAGDRGKLFASTYFSNDLKDFRHDGGYYELPYHPIMWNKRSGRTWPRGPGHNARADMKQLNEMGRSILTNLQFAAEPMILTSGEDIMTAADIEPHAIITNAVNERGQELVKTLDRSENTPLAMGEREQVRKQCAEAFRFSLMQIINRPQMTAQEFLGWKAERLRSLAPYLVRVQVGLAAFIARRYRLLARAGQTNPPPPELRGANVGIRFVSPLAKAQEAATGQQLLQWLGAVGNIAQASGRPDAWDKVDLDASIDKLHASITGIPGVLRDQRETDAIRQNRAAEQQQMAQLQKAQIAAGVVADVSHAQQASTLAAGRAPRAA